MDQAPVPDRSLKTRLQTAFAEYGKIALGTYLATFVIVFAAAAVALQFGLTIEGLSSTAGTLAAAWLATKLTQPLRILATLALTPIVAGVLRRRGPRVDPPAPGPTPGQG